MLNNIIEQRKNNKRPISKSIDTTQKTKFANKFDRIVDMAIRKKLIDESDRELKLLEVESLSEEEFNKYEKTVEAEVYVDVSNDDPNSSDDIELTEAEKALKKIRGGGGSSYSGAIPGVSEGGAFSGETRTLSDIKEDRLMSTMGSQMSYESINGDLSEGMEVLKQSLSSTKTEATSVPKKNIVARHEENPMSNLHGLTKPVVQQSKSFGKTLKGMFEDMNWSMGGR